MVAFESYKYYINEFIILYRTQHYLALNKSKFRVRHIITGALESTWLRKITKVKTSEKGRGQRAGRPKHLLHSHPTQTVSYDLALI